MSTVSTKHRPHRETPIPLVRAVEAPRKVEKAAHEGAAVRLGEREPEEGRHTTLSRLAYTRGPRRRPGEGEVAPRPHDEIYSAAHAVGAEMRARHFYMDDPQRLLISESRGALAPPPPGFARPSASNNRENALCMGAHNMFISGEDKAAWTRATSTSRASYHPHDTATMAELQRSSRELRTRQQTTHFALGTAPPEWSSEARANFRGAPEAVRATLCKSNVGSTVTLGSQDVCAQDSLRSLKQLDYVPHHVTPPPRTTAHQMQRASVVLGFHPPEIQSLHRASYTPTVFVDRDRAAAQQCPPGAACGMGCSPARVPRSGGGIAGRSSSSTPPLPRV